MEYKKLYVTKRYIAEVEDSELDFVLQDEFGINNSGVDVPTYIEFIEEEQDDYVLDGHPINIDRLINTLQGLKENGATHVEMEYHCDHISYPIHGYKLTKSTDEEVTEFTNKQAEKNAEKIKKEKERLEKELEKLSKLTG
jgi:hypothetical protein